MSSAKKKNDDERKVFNSEWCFKYLVVSHNEGVVKMRLLLCKNIILSAIT